MHSALKDKTNEKIRDTVKRDRKATEKEGIVEYLKIASNKTRDYDLKYDLTKCIEILEGKENQEYKDLKEALEEVLLEKEMLFKEKCELAVELDMLKSSQNNQL